MAGLLSVLNSAFYDGLPYSIVTLSFVLTFKYIRFPDITCASSFVLGGAISAWTTVNLQLPPVLAVFFACLAGAIAGTLTAFLHIVVRIDRLLAGILSAFMLYSINLMMLRPTLAYGSNPTLLSLSSQFDREILFGGIAWHLYAILLLLAIVISVKVALDCFLNSEFGLALRALEDDIAGPATLRRIGLNPAKFQLCALAAGNALVALAGAIVSAKEGAANLDRGFDVLITGLIAFLLGTQLAEWVPNLSEYLAKHPLLRPLNLLSQVRRLRATTLAAAGSLLYFGLIAISYRADIPSNLTKLLLAIFVVITVGDYAWLRTQVSASRSRHSMPVLRPEVMSDYAYLPSLYLAEIVEITYSYPGADRAALGNVSMSFCEGEMVRLVGENGTGKTTLLRLLSGEIPFPDNGHILFKGVDVSYWPSIRSAYCAYLAQDSHTSVIQTLSVQENLALASMGSAVSALRPFLPQRRDQELGVLLGRFNIDNSLRARHPAALSGGQRQTVNLLMISARNPIPKLVLLDEPFNNLDPRNAERCIEIIQLLRSRGTTVVIVDHSSHPQLVVDRQVAMRAAPQGAVSRYLHG